MDDANLKEDVATQPTYSFSLQTREPADSLRARGHSIVGGQLCAKMQTNVGRGCTRGGWLCCQVLPTLWAAPPGTP
jgi:hypothetical protein